MARLYAATGDGIARPDEADGALTVDLFLSGSGAQCLAVTFSECDHFREANEFLRRSGQEVVCWNTPRAAERWPMAMDAHATRRV